MFARASGPIVTHQRSLFQSSGVRFPSLPIKPKPSPVRNSILKPDKSRVSSIFFSPPPYFCLINNPVLRHFQLSIVVSYSATGPGLCTLPLIGALLIVSVFGFLWHRRLELHSLLVLQIHDVGQKRYSLSFYI